MDRQLRGKGGLLEILAEKLGCSYLSDLKVPEKSAAILRALEDMPAEAFTLAQWNELSAYLCQKSPGIDIVLIREEVIRYFRGVNL